MDRATRDTHATSFAPTETNCQTIPLSRRSLTHFCDSLSRPLSEVSGDVVVLSGIALVYGTNTEQGKLKIVRFGCGAPPLLGAPDYLPGLGPTWVT